MQSSQIEALIKEIPEGAEVAVTLRNGTTFKGVEQSGNLVHQGILRMVRPMTGIRSEDQEVFFTLHSEVVCFTMVAGK